MSVFLSSAPEDIAHRAALVRHLDPLRQRGLLRLWHDGLVKGGDDRAAAVRAEIDRASMVLLLVSADYLGSEECRAEMDRALGRSRSRDAVGMKAVRVVPILLRPCLSGFERIAGLSSLPTDGRPVTAWPDSDSAWSDVAHSIATSLGGAPFERTEEAPFLQADNDRLRLLKKLEDAHARRRRLSTAQGATAEIDAEILKLKRELRDGGQVRQGDILQGRYTLLRRIGRGGFATVWEAEDREQHMHVAVKILHADLAGDTTRRDRFFRGARIMTELGHDAVVRILATEQQDGGFHYLVMEHMAGGDLQAAVLEGRIPPERIVPLITRVGEALIAAHEHAQRFIHRDVKPANILLDEKGNPKLGDFDLVGGKETTGGTRTGAMGSFVYAAPEMLSRPQDADARADVFGLGMTALYCFLGRKLPDIAFRKPERVLAELGRPRIEAVLAKAVEWEPAARFDGMRSFCAALREAEEAEAERHRVRRTHTVKSPPAVVHSSSGASLKADLERRRLDISHSNSHSEESRSAPEPPASSWAILSKMLGALLAAIFALLIGIYGMARSFGCGGLSAPVMTTAAPTVRGATTESVTTESAVTTTSAMLAASSPLSHVEPCPPDMVRIVPPASVWIGLKVGEDRWEDYPHYVATIKPYCMERTEVTVAAYAKCVRHRKCSPAQTPSRDCNGNRLDRQDHPVNCVTFDESEGYCKAQGRRLPSANEWEFAARGPDEREYPWGATPPSNQLCWNGEGNTWGFRKRQSTCPVGKYHEGDSPFGLSDMAGNVWEWIASPYPEAPSMEVRGGSWFVEDASFIRGAVRSHDAPTERGSHLGFRCARD